MRKYFLYKSTKKKLVQATLYMNNFEIHSDAEQKQQ